MERATGVDKIMTTKYVVVMKLNIDTERVYEVYAHDEDELHDLLFPYWELDVMDEIRDKEDFDILSIDIEEDDWIGVIPVEDEEHDEEDSNNEGEEYIEEDNSI